MKSANPRESLERLLRLQRELEARIANTDASAGAVLDLGNAVLEFASSEEDALFPLLPLLDPAARAELGGEHGQFEEDLQLLQWLVTTTPDSPDVQPLTAALARRMHAHIARDGRLLANALRLAGHPSHSGS